jgi:hypothetical protein
MKIIDMNNLSADAARAGAKWWADHLRSNTPHNNGELLQSAFSTHVRNKLCEGKVNAESIQKFEDVLADTLAQALDGDDLVYGCVGIDYHPDTRYFGPALAASDIPDLALPIKSSMWFQPTGVVAACGYAAPRKPVWSTFDEVPLDKVIVSEADPHKLDDAEGALALVWMRPGLEAERFALVLRGLVLTARERQNWVDPYYNRAGIPPQSVRSIESSFREMERYGFLARVLPR